jgi:translation initiation factor 1
MTDRRLVYSTDPRRASAPPTTENRPAPAASSQRGAGGAFGLRARLPAAAPRLPDDGVIRVFRERGGRGGRVVTVLRGLPGGEAAAIVAELRRLCATGGAVKDEAVELQGDHRDRVAAWLRERGHRVKLAGG